MYNLEFQLPYNLCSLTERIANGILTLYQESEVIPRVGDSIKFRDDNGEDHDLNFMVSSITHIFEQYHTSLGFKNPKIRVTLCPLSRVMDINDARELFDKLKLIGFEGIV